jgi:hypothetical protein
MLVSTVCNAYPTALHSVIVADLYATHVAATASELQIVVTWLQIVTCHMALAPSLCLTSMK